MQDRDYEDVTVYSLDESAEAELLARQAECTFIWSNSAGHPVGVIMNYVFRDGSFWLTASSQRARVPAVRRDPRVSIVVSSLGSSIKARKSLTYKGQCVIHQDEATSAWFYPALAAAVRPGDPEAQAGFVRHLDSPRRSSWRSCRRAGSASTARGCGRTRRTPPGGTDAAASASGTCVAPYRPFRWAVWAICGAGRLVSCFSPGLPGLAPRLRLRTGRAARR